MVKADTFEPASPPAIPDAAACVFYTCMDFPDGTSVTGPWDIRGRFSEYIGHYPIEGKTLLDVGTASGFLAFSAESAGARVTALEGKSISEYDQLHFSGLYSVHLRTRKSAGESLVVLGAFRRCEVFGFSRGRSIAYTNCIFLG